MCWYARPVNSSTGECPARPAVRRRSCDWELKVALLLYPISQQPLDVWNWVTDAVPLRLADGRDDSFRRIVPSQFAQPGPRLLLGFACRGQQRQTGVKHDL